MFACMTLSDEYLIIVSVINLVSLHCSTFPSVSSSSLFHRSPLTSSSSFHRSPLMFLIVLPLPSDKCPIVPPFPLWSVSYCSTIPLQCSCASRYTLSYTFLTVPSFHHCSARVRRGTRSQLHVLCRSTIAVLVCVAVHGLSYSFSERLRRLQQSTTPPGRDYAPVSISFGAGFYLVAAAGGAAVLATATTLLRPTTPRPLGNNDYDRVDIGRQFAPDTAALICDEPPAYTP